LSYLKESTEPLGQLELRNILKNFEYQSNDRKEEIAVLVQIPCFL